MTKYTILFHDDEKELREYERELHRHIKKYEAEKIKYEEFEFLMLENFKSDDNEYDLLIIEDEIVHFYEIIQAAKKSGKIEKALICIDSKVLNYILTHITCSPKLITLDFKLGPDGTLKQAEQNYDRIKKKYRDTDILGITNYNEKEAKGLIKKMRGDSNFVCNKGERDDYNGDSIWTALSSILRNQMGILEQRKKAPFINRLKILNEPDNLEMRKMILNIPENITDINQKVMYWYAEILKIIQNPSYKTPAAPDWRAHIKITDKNREQVVMNVLIWRKISIVIEYLLPSSGVSIPAKSKYRGFNWITGIAQYGYLKETKRDRNGEPGTAKNFARGLGFSRKDNRLLVINLFDDEKKFKKNVNKDFLPSFLTYCKNTGYNNSKLSSID